MHEGHTSQQPVLKVAEEMEEEELLGLEKRKTTRKFSSASSYVECL